MSRHTILHVTIQYLTIQDVTTQDHVINRLTKRLQQRCQGMTSCDCELKTCHYKTTTSRCPAMSWHWHWHKSAEVQAGTWNVTWLIVLCTGSIGCNECSECTAFWMSSLVFMLSVSVYQCIRVLVYQCINVSVYACIGVSMYQCINPLNTGGSKPTHACSVLSSVHHL